MSTYNEIIKRNHALATRLATETGVSRPTTLNIIQYAKCLPRPSEPDVIDDLIFIAQMGFRFGLTSKYHIQLMAEAIYAPSTKTIYVEDYARMVSIFLSPDLDVKIDFVFRVYNFNREGFLRQRDVARLLKNAIVPFGEEDPHDQLKEMIDMIVDVIDINHDGMLSLEEFREFVKHDVLMLEMFGKVFPASDVIKSFQDVMEKHSVYQIRQYFRDERAECLGEPIKVPNAFETLYPGVALDLV